MDNVPDGSRGHPESVAPEFVGRSQLKVKISPPEVGEIWRSVGAEFGVILVISFWRNEATFVPVWPDWLEFDGSEGAESIQDVLVSHR
jgi:hypothetical protein